MSRKKLKTLTEQMFYILLCIKDECCGTDVMAAVEQITEGRVRIGPGTLYHLLEQFASEEIIQETACDGRKRTYMLTAKGREVLREEIQRLQMQINDYNRIFKER